MDRMRTYHDIDTPELVHRGLEQRDLILPVGYVASLPDGFSRTVR